MANLAIIGGSGFDRLPEFRISEKKRVATPFGEPSSPLLFGEFYDRSVIFLPRHGDDHSIAPHNINYRANIYALKENNVNEIVAFAAVGGITPGIALRTIIIPDQIIDYTWGRDHTFFNGESGVDLLHAKLKHVDFTSPYDESLRLRLILAAEKSGIAFTQSGVYATTQGPRLETSAEIDRLERDGADVVGMTAMPEAALARELNMAYACIALVVNEAAGRGGDELTMDLIYTNLAAATSDALAILENLE